MVTGSPGAGKTLSINSVLAGCECEVIRLNANLVRTVAEVQALITHKLLGDDTPRTAPQILRELEEKQYKGTCVVYVEEVELIFKSAPDAVSEDFLTLFLRKSVNLVLLGISNTIDTLQKYSGRYSFKITEI
jgi:Cdc6-like AAA superfamily ATPase